MNIVLGEEKLATLGDRYTVLSLDSFRMPDRDQPVRSFCVVESIPLVDMPHLAHWSDLHENLMKEYTQRNWSYCEQALEHLKGRWNGELDSFYEIMEHRIKELRVNNPGPEWDGVITMQKRDSDPICAEPDLDPA